MDAPAIPLDGLPARPRPGRWNLPNGLTIARLALIPLILFCFEAHFGGHVPLALALFIAASATDTLDGRLARRLDKVTELGKFLDPLADKLLIISVFAVLVQDHFVPAYVLVLIISRDVLVTGLRARGVAQGLIISASSWGKTKMVTQVLAVSLLMLERPYPFLVPVGAVAIVLAVGFTVLSAIDYLWRYRRLLYQ
jgi:CDP-diacylglycerol--glycerol-3-phosphate 3-phosphatidyltransferase